jgi:hypothetical protein
LRRSIALIAPCLWPTPASRASPGAADTAFSATGSAGRRGVRARLGSRLPDGLVDAVWLWLLLRVSLSILAQYVVGTKTARPPCPMDAHLAWLPRDGLAFPLLGAWHHWDACWYTTIA